MKTSDYCNATIYTPDNNKNDILFVYIHGGGLEGGSRKENMPLYTALTSQGITVASLDYSLYPEAKFPDYIRDCANGIKTACEIVKHKKLVIGGTSAGSYIAMMLAFDKSYFKSCGIEDLSPDAYVFDAGQPTVHYNVLRERGEDTRFVRIDPAAPLYFVDENADKNPRILITLADNDMQNRYEQNLLLRQTLLHFGYPENKITFKVIKGYGHSGYVDDKIFHSLLIDFIKS